MKRLLTALTVASVVLVAASARIPFTKPAKTGRSALKACADQSAPFDTVVAPDRDSVSVAGFEKTLRSTRESMYISNNTSRALSAARLEITYSDMAGRMLHKAAHTVDIEIPPGETRMVQVPSFDRQNLYYYHLSPAPTRASHATPFKVAVAVEYIICPTNPNP